jgi:predicted ATPase
MQAVQTGPHASPIVGRQAELDAIDAMLDGARNGRSRVLFLLGEPGIGKTTLLGLAGERAEGMTTVSARGIEAESELGYAGLADVLRPLSAHLDALVPHQRAALENVLAIGPPTPADPLGVAAAALSLLAAAAEREPLLVLVDDFHWLDAPSQLVLVFVARRLGVERVAMLFAARELPPALAQTGLAELRLEPLGPNEARTLLQARAPDTTPEVLGAIVETSGGNPLAIVELVSMLPEDQRTGRASLQIPLPVNGPVEAAFTDFVGGLDADAR